MDFVFYILAGAAVGFAIGVTGVGGGSLMTPILILFGFPFHIAIGTDLLYAAITKTGGVLAHQKRRTINWRIARLLALGSIPAALLTTYLLGNVFGDASNYEHILTTSLGIMLILTAAVLFFNGKSKEPNFDSLAPSFLQRNSMPLTVLMGLFLGVFVSLSSVGAGAIGTAVLLMLYPRLPAIGVVGTDIAHAVPLTLIAGLGHLIFLGNVDFVLLACLLVGSLPAVKFGTRVGAKVPNHLLRPILATILLLLGVKFALI